MRFSVETTQNPKRTTTMMMKRASTRTSLLLSAATYVSLHPNAMFTIFYVVTCNYHEYCYEQQQEQSYDEGDVEELRERLSFVEYRVPNAA
jgi:hypothetical protein